jgi:hypothetical protein
MSTSEVWNSHVKNDNCHVPAGREDCFRAGAIAKSYQKSLAFTSPTTRPRSKIHTLGVCCASVGLRRIEAGTRARATLLNITNECVKGDKRVGHVEMTMEIQSFNHLGESEHALGLSALRNA